MWLQYLDKIIKLIFFKCSFKISWLGTYIKFKMNNVKFNSNFKSRGVPIINVNLTGSFSIGSNLVLHSGKYYNMIGNQQPCYFIVNSGGKLKIGNNVGISCAAIVCWNEVTIGDNVRIGGGVAIYDTDFHSLSVTERTSNPEIKSGTKVRPVIIKDGAFIGAHSIILKGVTIGQNSVIGAGSVVRMNIGDNEIWAGNPAVFIKKTDDKINSI